MRGREGEEGGGKGEEWRKEEGEGEREGKPFRARPLDPINA